MSSCHILEICLMLSMTSMLSCNNQFGQCCQSNHSHKWTLGTWVEVSDDTLWPNLEPWSQYHPVILSSCFLVISVRLSAFQLAHLGACELVIFDPNFPLTWLWSWACKRGWEGWEVSECDISHHPAMAATSTNAWNRPYCTHPPSMQSHALKIASNPFAQNVT